MPSFTEFQYFYATSVLKISLFLIGILPVTGGAYSILFSISYRRMLASITFQRQFMWTQIFAAFLFSVTFIMAKQWNLLMGIPHEYVYTVSFFMESIELSLIMMPARIIIAKLTPPGIESSLMSLSASIIGFNLYTLRGLLGVFINKHFVGVDNDHLDKYHLLVAIQIVGSLIPLLFIKYMVPTNE